jgi:uncharacterized membrane protein
MKTYKIESVKATSLRKQLLYSNLAVFGLSVLAGITAATGAGDFALGILFGVVGCALWSAVAYWRAVWNLWEWPGIGLALVVALGVFILNIGNGFLGSFASIAFLVYVYVQLGKQSEEVIKLPQRDVFSE